MCMWLIKAVTAEFLTKYIVSDII